MRSISVSEATSMATTQPSTMLPPSPATRSPWHSPVPYLFGGLAAMLGLIAFALLILACSYWRISGRRQREGDIESGDEKEGKPVEKKVFEEKFLVIMAGDNTPTFLATPASNRAGVCGCGGDTKSVDEEGAEMGNEEKVKQGLYEHGEPTTAAAEAEEDGRRETPETTQQMEERN